MDMVAGPLAAAFAGGPPVSTCPHLDGLEALEDLNEVAIWAPSAHPGLVCAPCSRALVMASMASAETLGIAGVQCDGCGRQVESVTHFSTTDDPGPLLMVAAACATCCYRSTTDAVTP